jgi:CDP-diacylglycerol--serine O-phosphatidyltransferase
MNIFKEITIADLFSLGNGISGFLSIFFSINQKASLAIIFLVIAVLFDVLDGEIARLFHQSGKLGKYLDSLADIISFGVAPVVFGIMQNQSIISLIAYALFLCCGMLRLARFHAVEFKGIYEGMPITFNGIIFPVVFVVGLPVIFYPLVFAVSAVLMISGFKIKKIF